MTNIYSILSNRTITNITSLCISWRMKQRSGQYIFFSDAGGGGGGDLDALIDSYIVRKVGAGAGGEYECGECGKRSDRRHNLIQHVESKHVATVYVSGHTCDLCGAVSRTRNSLRWHKKLKHHNLVC